jgi:hypothetical protein
MPSHEPVSQPRSIQHLCLSRECDGSISILATLGWMSAGAAIVAFGHAGLLIQAGILLTLLCGIRRFAAKRERRPSWCESESRMVHAASH